MRGRLVLVCLLVLVLAGCTTTVPGKPTAQGSLGLHQPDINDLLFDVIDLFNGYNAAWDRSVEDGVAYEVEHNHPVLDYTVDECLALYQGHSFGYGQTFLINPSDLRPDFGWTIPEGRHIGERPDGFIYVITGVESHGDPAVPDYTSSDVTQHVAFLSGKVYFFYGCEPAG